MRYYNIIYFISRKTYGCIINLDHTFINIRQIVEFKTNLKRLIYYIISMRLDLKTDNFVCIEYSLVIYLTYDRTNGILYVLYLYIFINFNCI